MDDVEAVRPARADDATRFRELAEELEERIVAQRGASLATDPPWSGTGRAGEAGLLDDLLARPGVLVLVGTLDQVVTGFAVGRRQGTGAGARGVLEACYVEPGARTMGLGRLLVEAALAWFAAEGCRGVDGIAFPGDRQAKNFFESAGFKARLLTMYRPLD